MPVQDELGGRKCFPLLLIQIGQELTLQGFSVRHSFAFLWSRSHKTRFDAIAKHNNTNCVGRLLIKTFATAAEEVNQFRRNAPRAATSHLWKGRTCFAFQCFGLFYSDWLSTFRIFLPIHLSIGCGNL